MISSVSVRDENVCVSNVLYQETVQFNCIYIDLAFMYGRKKKICAVFENYIMKLIKKSSSFEGLICPSFHYLNL